MTARQTTERVFRAGASSDVLADATLAQSHRVAQGALPISGVGALSTTLLVELAGPRARDGI